MSILVDFSGVFYAAIYTDLKSNDDLNADFIRHLILNRIRVFNKKYRKEYGEMIICLDQTHLKGNWRNDYFKYYKASRKQSRDESDIDWDKIYEIVGMVVLEMKQFLPMKIIGVDRCEADDVIGYICESKDPMDKIMIVSGDKDMKQLQRYPNVKQFSPITNKQLSENKPLEYIREHIIRGDGSDGIPNIFAPEDQFVNTQKRQPAVTKKFLESVLTRPESFVYGEDLKLKRRFETNKRMVDLSQIPQEYKDNIEKELNNYIVPKGNKLYSYFMRNKMNIMINYINDFYEKV